MCGIAGLSGMVDEGALRLAVQAIAHRGPDDEGIFTDPAAGVGLGHRRLSILDLSPQGHQPMASTDGTVVLVYNGEIYNFRELRRELEMQGVQFRGNSDTEVLLNLYLREGEAMLPRLNGIFAFALWDGRKQSLFLARDALGVKPLYYAESGGRLSFASEIKALLHLAPEARVLDQVALHRYLSFLWCPGGGTPLKAVRKLAPGNAMFVRDGRIERQWCWYQLPTTQPVDSLQGQQAAIESTAAQLKRAVKRQMVADVPVGAFLSGGLDSSAVVALAREQEPDIRCFTIESKGGQEAGATDDLPYARKVARHLGVPLDVVRIEASRMAGDLEQMVAQLDEPLADPASLNVLYISRLAREQGIKVLLSGAGGDDLFTGYRRHRALSLERYWRWLPLRVRRALSGLGGRLDQRQAWARRLTKVLDGVALEGDVRLVNYFRWAGEQRLRALYTPAFRQALGEEDAAAPMLDFLQQMPQGTKSLERMLALEQRFFLADHNITYTDKMSMAAGVEVRVPFLDTELVELAAHIPSSFKQKGAEGKWILKKAMEPYLPREVIYRPKTGFGAPLRRWMCHDLRELMGDLLSEESLRRRGLFDPAAVQQLIADNESGRVDASYTLLSLLCIEIWCRCFLDDFGGR